MIEPRRNKFYDLDEDQQRTIMNTVKMYSDSRYGYATYRLLMDFLDSIDIVIAYNWPGHRGEFFAPTMAEMEGYIDYVIQSREEL